MLTSGYGMPVVLIQFSTTLFTCTRPARDQASKIPSMDKQGLSRAHTYLRRYWQMLTAERERLVLFQGHGCF